MKPIVRTCSITFAVLLASVVAWAQTPADDIRARVKDGQRVSITDDQGEEFKGRISEITADGLTLLTHRERVDIPYARVIRIDRPHDSLANGALIGLGTGAALGFLALLAEDNRSCDPGVWFDCSDPSAGNYLAAMLLTGGLGTAVGVGIDALIRRDPVIYRRGGGTRMTLSPALGPGVRGALLSVSW